MTSEADDLGEATRAAYNEVADRFVEGANDNLWNEHYERPVLRSLLPSLAGKRVLDSGCAGGAHTEWLLAQGAEVIAVDFSERMVELARARVSDRAEVRIHDIREPFDFIEDSTIDAVVFSLVIEYLEDLQPTFGEFARVLRSGGTLALSGHHPFADWQWFGLPDYYTRGSGTDHWTSIDHDMPWYRRTMEDVFNALYEAGFLVRRFLEPLPDPSMRERFPDQLEGFVEGQPSFMFIEALRS